jgi:hypothetical protein
LAGAGADGEEGAGVAGPPGAAGGEVPGAAAPGDDPGVAAGAATGAVAGMIVVARRCARIARENDVNMNTTATAVVSLPSTVGVLIDPKTAWLPEPPKADPISAPLPACSNTRAMMMRLTMM